MSKIDHPEHYGGDTTYEAIKVIEAWNLGFRLGNAVKYICRAGKKGDHLEDLRKARWYLDREIRRLEEEKHEETHPTHPGDLCKCGHRRDNHGFQGAGLCNRCECSGYVRLES